MKGDRPAGWMAAAFLVLLLASEAALTLPDADASDASVADFYVRHRVVIIVLQIVGFAAAGFLAGFAGRLYRVDRVVSQTGSLLAVLACLPGIVTIITAVVADRSDPGKAGTWNRLEPRGDDLLFIGVLLFAGAVLGRMERTHRWLGAIALLTVAACVARLLLETLGQNLGLLQSVAPICFLVLVGWLGALAFRGLLAPA